MPIQPPAAKGVKGTVTLFPQYQSGLADLEGFSHLILIYHFHLVEQVKLKVKPFLDTQQRGLFATRAPLRPNPIGISVVRLEKVDGNTLYIQDVDIVDGTPLLDIKPYVPDFEPKPPFRTGWYEAHQGKVENTRADDRFVSQG